MSTALQGRIAIRARQVKPGEAYAVEVKAGQYIQITDVAGKQVADFVAFNATNRSEHLSLSATRSVGSSIMLQKGMQLVSNRRTPMFELVDDSVGRHDILLALCDRAVAELEPEPVLATPPSSPTPKEGDAEEVDSTDAAESDGDDATEDAPNEDDGMQIEPQPAIETVETPLETVGCLTALSRALESYGIAPDHIPDPVNWFMNVGIKGRGELEVREPLSERNDYVILAALMDSVIAVTACSQTGDATNGDGPSDILVRVYR